MSETAKPDIENPESDDTDSDKGDLSLDEVSAAEEQNDQAVSDEDNTNNN